MLYLVYAFVYTNTGMDAYFNMHICIYVYTYIFFIYFCAYESIHLCVGTSIANGLGDQGSIPGRVI